MQVADSLSWQLLDQRNIEGADLLHAIRLKQQPQQLTYWLANGRLATDQLEGFEVGNPRKAQYVCDQQLATP
ncbi:hypothetical protein D3C76_1269710 [compost metagenome]